MFCIIEWFHCLSVLNKYKPEKCKPHPSKISNFYYRHWQNSFSHCPTALQMQNHVHFKWPLFACNCEFRAIVLTVTMSKHLKAQNTIGETKNNMGLNTCKYSLYVLLSVLFLVHRRDYCVQRITWLETQPCLLIACRSIFPWTSYFCHKATTRGHDSILERCHCDMSISLYLFHVLVLRGNFFSKDDILYERTCNQVSFCSLWIEKS